MMDIQVPASKLTPLMQQYWDVKSAHPDKILLFRMGDFYEMFHKDAETAAPVLGIALTSRNKKAADETKMCGVPHHSIVGPINKLLAAGYKVAICDQIEDPKLAKGIVKRAVTRILSPGVVYDPDTLQTLNCNYLCSYDDRHISFLELTTGEAFVCRTPTRSERWRLLEILAPVELVLTQAQKEEFEREMPTMHRPLLTAHEPTEGLDAKNPQPLSAQRLLRYAVYMQGESALQTLQEFEMRELLQKMDLPSAVVRHLEIFETYKGEAQGTLFHAVNRCKTSSGARLLKQWMSFPLAHESAIQERLDQVQYWFERTNDLRELRTVLGGLGDIQRRLGKIANPSCNPRDLKALSESLQAGLQATGFATHQVWDPAELRAASDVIEKIESTLVEEPPVQTKNGHIVRQGVSPVLDEFITLSTNSQQLIHELELRERESTGISSLKVRYNNVFGYYIEITNTHRDKVPPTRYQRKQTLTNAERYTTDELNELERKVLTAQTRRLELELEIFEDLKKFVLSQTRLLLDLALAWSELDIYSALAWLAIEQRYVRPSFTQSSDRHLCLKRSRHPVIEQALSLPFVANDIELKAHNCLLLTGPNMAGKSTLMRQVAVAAILAQLGSFVPADEAALPVFDRIFTRIGASDFLTEGLSTFMVEMKETAEMLKSATENSLVILDEVGRGTSTYDGMSLAQAILEYLLENSRALTLFATHYHELTQLETAYSQLVNGHMSIHEKNGDISFLHTLVHGAANRSYGIQVARLAGLPKSVTQRAAQILKTLEGQRAFGSPQLSLLDQEILRSTSPADEVARWEEESESLLDFEESGAFSSTDGQKDSIVGSGVEGSTVGSAVESDPKVQAMLEELRQIALMNLTPLEALNQIAKWQQSLS